MKSVKSEDQHFTAEKKYRTAVLILAFLLFTPPLFSANAPDEDAYRTLKGLFKSADTDTFEDECNSFLRKHNNSSFVPDVRLMSADRERDTETAVKKYRSVIVNYRYYPRRDYALYRICQILDLKSRWRELKGESENGIRLFSSGSYGDEFRLMHVTSLLNLGELDTAREEVVKITERTHNFETLSKAISLLAETERRRSGNSRSYIYNLRELAIGFKDSAIYPSIIYRLALFYDERGEFDKAYSAYSDITELFPSSPEAGMALMRIEKLKKMNLKKVAYMPDTATVSKTDEIDISPDMDIKGESGKEYYSVGVGPFTRIGDAAGIEKLLKNYDSVRRVKTPFGYMLYIGRFTYSENALDIRIRLAEEHGINGNIVRFSVHDKNSYIYEDR